MPHALLLVLTLLAAAVVVVVVCRLVHLPPILGYLGVGIVVGPHALALVPLDDTTRYVGEFGVVFLMFSIGLEFSLPQLARDAPRGVRARPRAGRDHHRRARWSCCTSWATAGRRAWCSAARSR